jgi:double zinc ribbon protein
MADDTTTIISVVLVFVMVAVTWLELRVLRKKSKARRERSGRRTEELEDEAHNALITTRAIASTLADRGGIRSEEVDSMLQEAQTAYNRHNYRVALDLTTRVKERLVALKGAQTAQGDAAKLDALPSSGESDEPTTKEVLQKQYPPNLVQSKFSISLAETSIESAEAAGRDVATARSLLDSARSRFESQDYGGALTIARQAEKSARGEAVAVSVAPAAFTPAASVAANPSPPSAPKPAAVAVLAGSACPSCGAPMKPDDTFCRKCGTRAVLTSCPTCGASLLADDAFCRKCGTRLQR